MGGDASCRTQRSYSTDSASQPDKKQKDNVDVRSLNLMSAVNLALEETLYEDARCDNLICSFAGC